MNDLPRGYKVGTAAAGFKKAGRDDLGVILSEVPAVCAGMFTTNAFKAAPVLVCQETLDLGGPVRAVMANSGLANACTGDEGMANCRRSREMVADVLGVFHGQVLPMSTGVIGAQFDMAAWERAVPQIGASLGSKGAEDFVRAFMTTDAFPKLLSRDVRLSGGTIRLTGMAKGAGMICPNMATMLSVVLTDAAVDGRAWQDMFHRAVSLTFNRVSVDGDTSTNDTILGLANGASGVSAVRQEDVILLQQALTEVLGTLAHMLVMDGEGATKVMHIAVTGAKNDADAEKVARTVGHSQLVKTAMYGRDANWGRIVAAVGRSGASFRPQDVRVSLCGVELFRNGQPLAGDFDEQLREPLEKQDIYMEISLGGGDGCYTLQASDLSHDYVSLNADYRS
ncbi:MAG: bifunctional glutamate N-acetyltransferase/amino-acid acetyltransferase ArgJ [Desulfovibrionaceae bacterium]|nr:bifunctional glutamate N-acetyltransferase/amino-acid acetyltransferase ArgJ [Desulfovibrionaceae bacterium]